MTMRLMKAFQIESNYQKHKQRLTSINSFNTKKKVTSTTYKNAELINNYKKHRLTAEIFNEKEKTHILTQNNTQIQKSLTSVYNREGKMGKMGMVGGGVGGMGGLGLKKVDSKSSVRSSIKSLNAQNSRIKQQNVKLIKKIQKTKSHYSKFRETQYSKRDKKETYREQLIRLLQTQLGARPKVVFPSVKSRKNKEASVDDSSVHRISVHGNANGNGNGNISGNAKGSGNVNRSTSHSMSKLGKERK